ncbi:hypothetical protein PoB_007349100 [Plakobranchus ocellatus]|uniref:Uncharacterized protein n=1 Tax=Plakobranchus ocellatus TaxID=259542 RepID=A0AAV4DSB9_9GAST|nr:hypothetical protein PoB_007349100 [Plakobranchus ocellatus]
MNINGIDLHHMPPSPRAKMLYVYTLRYTTRMIAVYAWISFRKVAQALHGHSKTMNLDTLHNLLIQRKPLYALAPTLLHQLKGQAALDTVDEVNHLVKYCQDQLDHTPEHSKALGGWTRNKFNNPA